MGAVFSDDEKRPEETVERGETEEQEISESVEAPAPVASSRKRTGRRHTHHRSRGPSGNRRKTIRSRATSF
jgi:hypothetical protein